MKKIILSLLLLISALFASSISNTSDVNWQKDLKTALQVATKTAKPLLLVSSRHTCKYCVMLDETTFRDARVIKALNNDFITFTSYSDEGDVIPQELWRPGTPAIWFLLPSGEPMYEPLMGAVDADNFLKALAIVKEEFKKTYKKKKNDFYRLKK